MRDRFRPLIRPATTLRFAERLGRLSTAAVRLLASVHADTGQRLIARAEVRRRAELGEDGADAGELLTHVLAELRGEVGVS